MDHDERRAFLKNHEGSQVGLQDLSLDIGRRSRTRFSTINILLFVVNATLLVSQVALFFWGLPSICSRLSETQHNVKVDDETYSPAKTSIWQTAQIIDTHSPNSSFIGNPRPEVDKAWSDIMRSSMVRLSEKEMKKMKLTSLALRDGSGYVGYLEAHHMLHCVKRIYQFQYQEYYHDLEWLGGSSIHHWEHCLEVLRRGIMCHADPAINTYTWNPANRSALLGEGTGARKCVDWDRFQAWADERSVQPDRTNLLHYDEAGYLGPL